MVIVNTCVVHLRTNKLYCTGNLHEKEYSLPKPSQYLMFCTHFDYLKHTCQCGFWVMNNG